MKKRGEYLMRMNKRYFVMNPDDGTFIRYEKKEDFPNKPLEVIPLKDIS
jgi:serum/glucocorticoid-regulated kinase 2